MFCSLGRPRWPCPPLDELAPATPPSKTSRRMQPLAVLGVPGHEEEGEIAQPVRTGAAAQRASVLHHCENLQ